MPKLYYTPVSCGAASFIAAVAAGVHFETEKVDMTTRLTSSGVDFKTINPKGNVDAFVLKDGTVINESAAMLQFVADQAPGKVAPEYGTSERYLLQNVLNFLASEVHSLYVPLFYGLAGEAKEAQIKKIYTKFEYITKYVLNGRQYLVGNTFSVADGLFYIFLTWNDHVGVDLTSFPEIRAYSEFIGALPCVAEAVAAMSADPSST
eukprot:CAMPEP_0184985724 /NCGR_PEP_ID=MMETSP1098-20130426/14264_1 /TAXON_ID=89044 /ORGANISM="Spumella elongata, Strain CCAP 955/1" /LENGTH=205 /DNA_ID=CAMNT_0027509821 /DNA_START=41 /DNA_END=658 /DNA_ORIENTATION=+